MKPGELLGWDWQVATEAKIAYPVSRKQLNLFLSAYLLFESKAKKDIISDIEQWDLKSEG